MTVQIHQWLWVRDTRDETQKNWINTEDIAVAGSIFYFEAELFNAIVRA